MLALARQLSEACATSNSHLVPFLFVDSYAVRKLLHT